MEKKRKKIRLYTLTYVITGTLTLLLVLLRRALDLVHPVPLATRYLHGHRRVHRLVDCETDREDWKNETQGDQHRHVEEQELQLHNESVVAVHIHSIPVRIGQSPGS